MPIVGNLSDGSTFKLGRRRPFALIGLLLAVPGLIMFSAGVFLLPKSMTQCVLAIVFFVVSCVGLEVMQCPLRALLSDICTPEQQLFAHSLGTTMNGIGRLAANVLVYFSIKGPTWQVFVVVVVLLLLSMIPVCLLDIEVPMSGLKNSKSPLRSLSETLHGLRTLPRRILLLMTTQAFAWMAWFCFLPYATDYFTKVFNMVPSRHSTKDVQRVALGMSIASGVQIIVSHLIPRLSHLFVLYALSLVVLSVSVLLLSFPRFAVPEWSSLLLMGVSGVSLAFSYTLPYLVTSSHSRQKDQLGLANGALDMSVYAAMMIVTAYSAPLPSGSSAWGVRLGALWAMIAAIMAVINRNQPKRSVERIILT
eukprot:c17616_g1_i1.p1 GENE.c17616_g1_i1~~c17616_g1_i1.p1  ORF type:complete len:364 (+),score=40.83 c17616_g1_i1:408-1499(+)